MIADQVQKGLVAGKVAGQAQSVSVAARLTLFEKAHAIDVRAGGSAVGIVIAGDNHEANFLDARRQNLFDDDLQGGLVDPIAVHEGLQRKSALFSSCRGDNGFAKVHGRAVPKYKKSPASHRGEIMQTVLPDTSILRK